MSINRKFSELLEDLLEVINDLDGNDSEKASAVKTLMLYDKENALNIVDKFIEKKAVWAIKIGLEIKKKERDAANDHTARLNIDEC